MTRFSTPLIGREVDMMVNEQTESCGERLMVRKMIHNGLGQSFDGVI
jgi:hypothetical protein